MSFIIKPLESILDAPKLICCINGKTETEFSGADEDAFSESIVDNEDGTFTTTWTMNGEQSSIFEILFKMCCSKELKLSVTVSPGGIDPPETNVYFGPSGGEDLALVYTDIDSFSDVVVSDQEEAKPFYPISVCGLIVTIEGIFMESVGDEISITI